MKKFTFSVGIFNTGRVTVRAKDLAAADTKARDVLDRRYGSGRESPVRFDLRLISTQEIVK